MSYIYIVNTSPSVHLLIRMLKPFISAKVWQRIYLDGKNIVENLGKHLVEYEYGGSMPSIDFTDDNEYRMYIDVKY